MNLLSTLLLLFCLQEDPVQDALKTAAEKGYSFEVGGLFDRKGEFTGEPLLVSRIRQYRSVRTKDKMLYRGPAGLWQEYGEIIGEDVENPDSDVKKILDTLTSAEPPHQMVRELLVATTGRTTKRTTRINGKHCDVHTYTFKKDYLRAYMEGRLRKAEEGGMEPPDEILWSSLKGTLRIYLDKKTGNLVRAADHRALRFKYKDGGAWDAKTYKVDLRFDFDKVGETKVDLPPIVRKKLGLGEK